MKFSQFINEYDLQGEGFEIYIDPSFSQIEETKTNTNRGWISPDGTLYMIGNTITDSEGTSLGYGPIHADLLLSLKQNKVPFFKNKTTDVITGITPYDYPSEWGIGVIRRGSSNDVFLAESYIFDADHYNRRKFETLLSIIGKAKNKNPSWNIRHSKEPPSKTIEEMMKEEWSNE
jgi:hypothetical protein